MKNPLDQQMAATTPVLRGPTRSTQAPNTAADDPRKTKKRVYIQPRVLIFQSQSPAISSSKKLVCWGTAPAR